MATATAPAAVNPELESIYKSLHAEVQSAIQKFIVNLQSEIEKKAAEIEAAGGVAEPTPASPGAGPVASGPAAPSPTPDTRPGFKSLPWFQHGVRGFVNKLWYGDHPQNPNWSNVRREHVQLALSEYMEVRETIENLSKEYLFEDAGIWDFFKPAIKNLTSDIIRAINKHFKQAQELGRSEPVATEPKAEPAVAATEPEPEAPAAVVPTAEPAEPAASPPNEPEPTAEPQAKPKRLRAKPFGARAIKKDAEPPKPTEPRPINDVAKELSNILKTTNDKKEMAGLLQQAGITFKGGKVTTQSLEKLIRIVHAMSQQPESIVQPDDWLLGDYEDLFGIKVPDGPLGKARVAIIQDLEKDQAQIESVLFNTIRGHKILKEVRTLPIKNRIAFYRNSLRNLGV